MKNIHYILLILTSIFFTSCEDVVNVDLDTAAPRLVVDASINWEKGTDGSLQTITLTTTTGYYEETVPPASNATVFVENSKGNVFTFKEMPNSGKYNCNNFLPEIGETYILTVIYKDETYTATETLFATPNITRTVQNNNGGFLGEDVEVRFFYDDDGSADNFYMNRFDAPVIPYPDYDLNDDEFFQGNEMFGIFSDEDLIPGDVVHIRLFGISERYYNYMSILVTLAEGGSGGGPFQTPPSTVRGNLINQSNEDNYALGYFRLGEVSALNYTIQ